MKELFTLYYHRRILFTDFFSQSLDLCDSVLTFDRFMSNSYISLRELEEQCKVNLRFMYLTTITSSVNSTEWKST